MRTRLCPKCGAYWQCDCFEGKDDEKRSRETIRAAAEDMGLDPDELEAKIAEELGMPVEKLFLPR